MVSLSFIELNFNVNVCEGEGYQSILKLSCRPFAFTLCKAFLKTKKRSGTSFSASFCMNFKEKHPSRYINWQNFIVWLPLLDEILDNKCIETKIKDKSLNILRTKEFYR